MEVGPIQNGKQCRRTFSRTQQKWEEWWKNRRKQAKHPNARLLGSFPSILSVFWRVPHTWLNVLAVEERARSLRKMACSGFHLMTNAKSIPSIPINDGYRVSLPGKSLEQRES